jgi:cytochrome c-type biogenesis protein
MDAAVTSFLLGVLSMASPCVLPLYPGFLAYLTGQTESGSMARPYVLGGVVLLGVLSTMVALGAVIAGLSVPISRTLAILVPVSDALLFALGAALILNRNPFRTLPQLRVPVVRRPLVNAYLYGVLYGPIALPCSGPLVVGVFALSFTVSEALGRLWVFAWFGLGFGMPLLVLSLMSGAYQRRLTIVFAEHGRVVNLAGGVLLVGVALYDLRLNWELLRAFYT